MMTRGPTLVAILLAALFAGHEHPLGAFELFSQDITVLEPGISIGRELASRQEHLYQLALSKDEYARVIVEQLGVDVVVQARRPDGGVIADFQFEIRRQGFEQVEVVADEAGTYVLAVLPGPGLPSGSYAIRLAERRAATDSDRSLQQARALRTKAIALHAAAKYEQARPLLERALAIAEAMPERDDVLAGVLTFDLAGTTIETRNDARAQSLYERSIAILEPLWGSEHPYPAMARSRLALLQQQAGQGPKAEALLRQATEVIQRTLGEEHPWFVVCLTTQGNLRADAGDLDAAEAIERRALSILEKIGDTGSARYAALLVNLGDVYRQKGDNARARELFERALAVTVQLEGPDSFHVSIDYQNLGIVAREQGDYVKALEYDMRALMMRERIVGADHPDIAPLLNNVANVERSMGDDTAALSNYFRALAIWEKTRGPYFPGTLNVVGNIARTYASAGDIANAIKFQRRADAIVETELALNLAVGSERQKLAFVNTVSTRTDRTISLSLNEAAGDQDASALASLVLLQRKGRVQDAMIDMFGAVRQRMADPKDLDLMDRLRTTTAQLSKLALNAPNSSRQEDRQTAIKEAEAQKEQLEAELSAHSAEFRAEMRPVTLQAVQAAMPEDAALVEFAVFHPFNPKAQRNADASGPPHYAAYIIRNHGAPVGRDLGPSNVIDEAIDRLRQALRDPAQTDVKARARAVDERVMRPLRGLLGGATRLLISPDGDLNLVPFDAFVDEAGHYAIERYAISYLTSGRDLLRLQTPVKKASPSVVIVADPSFGEPPPTRGRQSGDELSSMYFSPLAGAAAEARAIDTLFPEATLLTGRAATKTALERLEAPGILHIASHGFFLQREVENPLLRSGLALAGANQPSGPRADGILTALEASALNLRGTKLVALSACDSGVGEVRNGEGVYGLRRAFVLAGSETLVMSLWPVSDAISRETMVAYYTGLRVGLGRGDALREAKLDMLKRSGRQHPFYWASFIQSGEWASLDGDR